MVVLVLKIASNIGQSHTIENCVRGIRPDFVYVCDSMFESMLAPLTVPSNSVNLEHFWNRHCVNSSGLRCFRKRKKFGPHIFYRLWSSGSSIFDTLKNHCKISIMQLCPSLCMLNAV